MHEAAVVIRRGLSLLELLLAWLRHRWRSLTIALVASKESLVAPELLSSGSWLLQPLLQVLACHHLLLCKPFRG